MQTGSLLADTNRLKFHGDEHYLRTAEEMRRLFRELPEACDNTLRIADSAELEIAFGQPRLPHFDVPDGYDGDRGYLQHLTLAGARERWGDPLPEEVADRLAFELEVINNMGFASYFLITWDLIAYARRRGIRVGPGRGSAAGCAVAYSLRITDLDPIRYGLLFERFLNPRPRVDARHRHGLRLSLPRRAHQLRGGALRTRPCSSDHHLRADQGASRGA